MDVRQKVKKDYLAGMKYKDICDKHDLSINTLKSWIKRHGWATEKKEGAPKRKRGAPLNNKNAVGNRGGAAPPKNKNAEKHGFFSKYLPEDTLDIMREIENKNSLDLLWDNITIQYTAIIRAQRIMHVTDKDEMIKELKRSYEKSTTRSTSNTDSSSDECEYEWNFQFAWDRQATLLKAQSRAMGELRSMIKQYDELLKTELATEEQKLRIEKLKAEVKQLKGGGEGGNKEGINDFIKAAAVSKSEITKLYGDEADEDIPE